MLRGKVSLLVKRSYWLAIVALTLLPINETAAHICWTYTSSPAIDPQPWIRNGPTVCDTSDYLHPNNSTTGQTIGEEHRNWHCTNPVAGTIAYGRAFLAFHRQFILDFNIYRLGNGYQRLEAWDPLKDAEIPGDDETENTDFTHCSIQSASTIRPAHTPCSDDPGPPFVPGCESLPQRFIGPNNLAQNFSSLGALGLDLDSDQSGSNWHNTFHNGVRNSPSSTIGCQDIGTFLYAPRDPAFWMAHTKLDEVARDWQALQAADIVLVLDATGSVASSNIGDDIQEAARSFADLINDNHQIGGTTSPEQHRLALVSFHDGDNFTTHMGLSSVVGLVTNNNVSETAFEQGLDNYGNNLSGFTSITAGIRAALDILNNAANPNRHQAILVLTDGIENTKPCLEKSSVWDWFSRVFSSSQECTATSQNNALDPDDVGEVQIVAIGFGPGAEEVHLRNVAERHGGIFLAEPDLTGTLDMQKFFITAFGEMFDTGTYLDPKGTLLAGEVASSLIPIDVCDEDQLEVALGFEPFSLLFDPNNPFPTQCEINLALFTPTGVRVNPNDPAVETGHGPRHDFIRTQVAYQGEQLGTWNAQLERPLGEVCPDQDYFVSVLVKGLGRVKPWNVRPNIVIGRKILAAFRISETHRPIGGFDSVTPTVTLTRPDGSTDTQALFDDGTNGDQVAGNNIWSFEFPAPAVQTGIHKLRAHFELEQTLNDPNTTVCTRTREAAYAIIVRPTPPEDSCLNVIPGGTIGSFVRMRPQPGDVFVVEDQPCIANMCDIPDQFQIEFNDSLGWLRTRPLGGGPLIPLPSSYSTGSVGPFETFCLGRGPDEGNPAGGTSVWVEIPSTAAIGTTSDVSVRVTSMGHPTQLPIDVATQIEVFGPPDCNNNGLDDAIDVANGTSLDDNQDGVPDECQQISQDDPIPTLGFWGLLLLLAILAILMMVASKKLREETSQYT